MRTQSSSSLTPNKQYLYDTCLETYPTPYTFFLSSTNHLQPNEMLNFYFKTMFNSNPTSTTLNKIVIFKAYFMILALSDKPPLERYYLRKYFLIIFIKDVFNVSKKPDIRSEKVLSLSFSGDNLLYCN